MEKIVIADGTAYKDWITEITDEFRKSQIRAAVKINDEMLRFYWKLGKDISAVARNECRFKFFLARRIYSFTDYYRSFAYYSRF